MSKPNTICRVCGREYYCCVDHKELGGFKSMACSIECYKEYIKRIEDSRKSLKQYKKPIKVETVKIDKEISVLDSEYK